MRLRALLGRVAVTAAVAVAATVTPSVPAAAGGPESQSCTEIVKDVVTIGVKPNVGSTDVDVCYATSDPSNPQSVLSGRIAITIDAWTSPYPGVRIIVRCHPDQSVVGPVRCYEQNTVHVFPALAPTAGAGPACLIPSGSDCLLWGYGAWVKIQPVAVFDFDTTIGRVAVPTQCVPLFLACP